MTIELIDQSDPDKLKFRCDICGRTFVQSNWSKLDLHTPNVSQASLKAGVPPCQPEIPKASPVVERAPKVAKA